MVTRLLGSQPPLGGPCPGSGEDAGSHPVQAHLNIIFTHLIIIVECMHNFVNGFGTVNCQLSSCGSSHVGLLSSLHGT